MVHALLVAGRGALAFFGLVILLQVYSSHYKQLGGAGAGAAASGGRQALELQPLAGSAGRRVEPGLRLTTLNDSATGEIAASAAGSAPRNSSDGKGGSRRVRGTAGGQGELSASAAFSKPEPAAGSAAAAAPAVAASDATDAPSPEPRAGGSSSGGAAGGGGSLALAAPSEDPNYVALCVAVRDEHPNIREWVAYHAMIGVGRIYVYDDGSSPPMREALADFMAAGLVHYRLLSGPLQPGLRQQLAIYSDCLASHGANHTWLGAWDLDEFLVIRDGSPSLPAVLRRYEAYGGVGINWRLFGSSGHKARPAGGVLASFTKCTETGYPENVHIKSLVQPRRTLRAGWSPHHFDYRDGYFAVNTNRTRIEGPWSNPPLGDVLAMHHYALRSAEEFAAKMAKGNAMGPDHVKHQDFWDRIEQYAVLDCTYAVPLGQRVQARLAAAAAAGAAGSRATDEGEPPAAAAAAAAQA